MKILFLSQIVPYPPHGGVLQRGYNIIKEINKYFDIHLLAFVHPDVLTSKSLIEESRRELSEFCDDIEYFELWPKKTKFHKYLAILFGLFTREPFSVLAHRSMSFQKRISEILSTGKIDMVHCDTIGLAQWYHNGISCPAILTHHNIESQLIHRRAQVEKNPLSKFYLNVQKKRLERYEVIQSTRFSCNIMMSELDSIALKKKAPTANTYIIPNGVDPEYYHPRPGFETEALIYTGSMNMYANKDAVLYFLQEIWPLLKSKKPECIFYVIGENPPKELTELSQKDSSVITTGFVEDVRPYVAKASVYIVPLRIGGGTRLKVVDAMAQGKAIVSTTIGCEGIPVNPGGDIIIADSPSLFADEVVNLLNDENRRKELGTAARNMVKVKYSWEVIGKEIEMLYEKLILDKCKEIDRNG